MLQAAAMLVGLLLLWFSLTSNWATAQDIAIGAAIALGCILTAWRFGGFDRSSAPLTMLALRMRQAADVLRGAFGALRGAVAADVSLEPALVRIKPRLAPDAGRAAFAHALSVAPGMIVVESDADGLLAHVLHEGEADANAISELENRLLASFKARPS